MKKKQTDMQKIAEGIAKIEGSRKEIEGLVTLYDGWIDEAATLGRDEHSDLLIEEKVDLINFVADLKFLELQMRNGAVTANAFSKLGQIPVAIASCKALLKEGPDFNKLTESISNFHVGLRQAKTSLASLKNSLAGNKFETDNRVVVPRAESSLVKAEKAARELRLMSKKSSQDVAMPKNVAEKVDILDIDAIIDDVNKRK